MSSFQERQKGRTEYFLKVLYKKKLIICSACNCSGYYDTTIKGKAPKCQSCKGIGKIRET